MKELIKKVARFVLPALLIGLGASLAYLADAVKALVG